MGAFAGIAAALGGAGGAAQQYGQQIRGLLEQRRTHLAELLTAQAQQELDPQRRSELLGHASDLYAGKDITKVLPAVMKTAQDHMQSNDALAQMVGGAPAEPKSVPAPAGPGQNPGKGSSLAAQPSTSPVQPNSTPMAGGFSSQPAPIPTPPPQVQAPAPTPQGLPGLPESLGGVPTQGMMQTPAGRQLLQPFLSNSAEFARTRGMAEIEMGWKQKALQQIRQSPEWQAMPDFMKSQYELWASTPGQQMPAMGGFLGSMMTPVKMSMTADQVIHNWPDAAKEAGLEPGNHPVEVALNKMTMAPITIGARSVRGSAMAGVDQNGNISMVMENPYQLGAVPSMGGVTPQPLSQIRPISGANPQGEGEFTTAARARMGLPPTHTGMTLPSFAPTTTTEIRPIQTQDAQGNAVTQLVPVQSIRTRGGATSETPSGTSPGPVAPVPPVAGGGRSFPKPFTPQQSLVNEQQLKTITRAEGVMGRLRDNSHLMDSMIESGKLKLEAGEGGILRAVVNKSLPLTPAEAQFAADFTTMAEDINLLRKPLGGSGFRSTESWVALQGLKGSLMQHPEVSRRVMDNTLQAFEALREPLAKRVGGGSGLTPPPGESPSVVDRLVQKYGGH